SEPDCDQFAVIGPQRILCRERPLPLTALCDGRHAKVGIPREWVREIVNLAQQHGASLRRNHLVMAASVTRVSQLHDKRGIERLWVRILESMVRIIGPVVIFWKAHCNIEFDARWIRAPAR